uniref:hypothetical protein n=1 Tax=Streptomyces anthocyanicus TaxID=68174 RepID=UPI002F91974E
MVANPGLNELAELGDLLIEEHHLLRERLHHLAGQLLLRQAGVLAPGRCDRGLGELIGSENFAFSPPRFQALGAEPTDDRRLLVAGQQHQ